MIETRLDISFQEPVERRPLSANFAESGMATAIGTKAVAGVMEVGALWTLVDTFEKKPNDLLHDFISGGGYSSFSHFSIGFGYVDGSDWLKLKLLGSHLLDDLSDHVEREPIQRFSVCSWRHVSWG